MNKKQIGALFDLDGVVIDTEGVYSRFWEDIEKKYPTGIPDFAVKIKGTNLNSIMSHYTDPVAKAAVLDALAEFEKTMVYEIFPDAERFLKELKAAGVPCAMVTSSGEMKLQRLFAQQPHLKGYFDAIVSGEMVSHSKPHPECFLKGAEMIGCRPEDCVVFEDSLLGVRQGFRRKGRGTPHHFSRHNSHHCRRPLHRLFRRLHRRKLPLPSKYLN